MVDYFEKLRRASRARDSLLCVGLDPDPERIEGGLGGAVAFCLKLVAATSDVACCFKPNAAFWEQFGPEGWAGLAEVRAAVPDDVPVLLDCKRGDVPNTMAAYAAGVFGVMGFDAATVHAYHGLDSVRAFLGHVGRGVYVVAHSSDPGRRDLQYRESDGEPLFMGVASLAVEAGDAGVVMGATGPAEARLVRDRFPELPFLVPGLGRQGGDVEAIVRAAYTGDPASCLVSVSGAIMYADDPRGAAVEWRDAVRRVVRACAV